MANANDQCGAAPLLEALFARGLEHERNYLSRLDAAGKRIANLSEIKAREDALAAIRRLRRALKHGDRRVRVPVRLADQADQSLGEDLRELRKVNRLEAVSALLERGVLRGQEWTQNRGVILRPNLVDFSIPLSAFSIVEPHPHANHADSNGGIERDQMSAARSVARESPLRHSAFGIRH